MLGNLCHVREQIRVVVIAPQTHAVSIPVMRRVVDIPEEIRKVANLCLEEAVTIEMRDVPHVQTHVFVKRIWKRTQQSTLLRR